MRRIADASNIAGWLCAFSKVGAGGTALDFVGGRKGVWLAGAWGLEDIGKPLSGFLEPGIARPGHGGGRQGVDAQAAPVGQTAPDEHFSCLLDDEGEPIGHKPEAKFFVGFPYFEARFR